MSIGSSLDKIRAEQGIIVQKGKPYLEDYPDASPFPTASGKVELYSADLAEAGYEPLPVYEPVAEPPAGYFRLLYGRHPVHTFAKTQNTPLLHELYPENEVWVNEDSGASQGLKQGDYIWLENQDGARSGPIKVKLTQRIRPDAVYMVHGFGQAAPGLSKANGRGASDTKLQTVYKLDPLSGGAGMRVNFVRIIREA
jgi:thiosulfate reductase/polysulfide reductase chain A